MRIEPGKPRSVIESDHRGVAITIPSQRNWFVMWFLGFWMCGWLMGEVMVPTQFFKDDMPSEAMAFTVVWLAVWTLGGLVAGYILAWQLAGKEVISVVGNQLTMKRDLWGFGRLKEFGFEHIQGLRVSPQRFNPFDISAGVSGALRFWGIGGGSVAFDYGAKTYRFGSGLDEAEAKLAVDAIAGKAPQLAETGKSKLTLPSPSR